MKYLKILIIVFVGISLFSCEDDFLSPVPTAVINGENFPTTESQLEEVVIATYDALQGVNQLAITSTTLNHGIQIEFYVTEMLSDNTRSKSSEGEPSQFNTFEVETTNSLVFDYYRSMYDVITKANLVLDNIDIATTNRAAIEGQVRFLRGLAYYNLVTSFGDVPLIDRTIAIGDTEIQFTRVAESEILQFVVDDLLIAVSSLGETSSPNVPSVYAAQALLAKVYMTQGSNYVAAQSLLESIINSDAFELEPNYSDIWSNESNTETIFSVGFVGDTDEDSQNYSAEMQNAVGRSSGQNYLTDDLILAFANFGGDRSVASFRIDPSQASETQTIKYLPDSSDPRKSGNDWIVIRYADVLLLHVESILAGGVETGAAAAITSFELVRDRAGIAAGVTSISSADLLNERRVELAFENHRLNDLKRFGVAQQILSDFSNALEGGSFQPTDLLLPLPQFEINLSLGALNQNPGY